MIIKTLKIYNFGPFYNLQEVKLEDGVYFIQGKYEDNPEKSNRAGKSTFIEAILFCLFGEVREKITEVDMIHHAPDVTEMWVECTFEKNSKTYTIKRGRTLKNKPILEISWAEPNTATQAKEEIAKVINLSFDDFINTFFFKQDDIHGFMEYDSGERKSLIQRWMNLAKWEDYSLRAKEQSDKVYENYTSLKSQESQLDTELKSIVITETEEDFHSKIKAQEKIIEELESLIQIKRDELAKLPTSNTINVKLLDAKNRLSQAEKLYVSNNAQCANLSNNIQLGKDNIEKYGILKKNRGEIKVDDLQNIFDSLKSEINSLESTLRSSESQIAELKSKKASCAGFKGVCPVDCNPCDKGNRVLDFSTEISHKIETISFENDKIYKGIEKKNIELSSIKKQIAELKTKDRELALINIDIDIPQLEAALCEVKKNLQTILDMRTKAILDVETFEKELKSIDLETPKKLQIDISKLTTECTMCRSEIMRLNRELGSLLNSIKSKENKTKNLEKVRNSLNSVSESLYQWKYLSFLLSKEGIPAMLVESNIQTIEETANYVLSQILPSVRLEITTVKDTKTKEIICNVCGQPFNDTEICVHCGYGRQRIQD